MSSAADRGFAGVVGGRIFARGDLRTVATAAWKRSADHPFILEDATGRVVDVDLRGDLGNALARLAPSAPAPTRGRPKLGVTAREVTLLPRHWDWLATQPGGASAALRRLVEQASRDAPDTDERRRVQETVYRVTTTLGGDRHGYEEAIRALFAGDVAAFHDRIAGWPPDISGYLRDLSEPLSGPPDSAPGP